MLATGCSSLRFQNDSTRTAELSWQAIHAIDTAQTVTIARSAPCLYEANPLAAAIYGSEHPSVRRVLATNAAMASLHWAVGSWLDRRTERALQRESGSVGAWYVLRGAYYLLSILGSGAAVAGNVQLGVRPLSHMRCDTGAR